MDIGQQQKWDRIYSAHSNGSDKTPAPCHVLTQYEYLLPASGKALDLACGLGGNALFLADRNLKTLAVDISTVALEKLSDRQHSLIECRCQSADADNIGKALYDVVVVSCFLERALCSSIVQALVPGGLLFYQTFVRDKVDVDVGPGNPEYLLKRNELLLLFADLDVVVFSDLANVGEAKTGFRNQSFIVGQRPL